MCCPIEEKLASSGNHKDQFDCEKKMREIVNRYLINQRVSQRSSFKKLLLDEFAYFDTYHSSVNLCD
jgi:hypothetical protein